VIPGAEDAHSFGESSRFRRAGGDVESYAPTPKRSARMTAQDLLDLLDGPDSESEGAESFEHFSSPQSFAHSSSPQSSSGSSSSPAQTSRMDLENVMRRFGRPNVVSTSNSGSPSSFTRSSDRAAAAAAATYPAAGRATAIVGSQTAPPPAPPATVVIPATPKRGRGRPKGTSNKAIWTFDHYVLLVHLAQQYNGATRRALADFAKIVKDRHDVGGFEGVDLERDSHAVVKQGWKDMISLFQENSSAPEWVLTDLTLSQLAIAKVVCGGPDAHKTIQGLHTLNDYLRRTGEDWSAVRDRALLLATAAEILDDSEINGSAADFATRAEDARSVARRARSAINDQWAKMVERKEEDLAESRRFVTAMNEQMPKRAEIVEATHAMMPLKQQLMKDMHSLVLDLRACIASGKNTHALSSDVGLSAS
jgi:hypothetical protein